VTGSIVQSSETARAKAPANLGIQLLNPLNEPLWAQWLGSRADSGIFHTAQWAQVLASTYGHHPTYFTQINDGRLSALCCVMEVSSPLIGRRGVALPFTDACPPLASEGVSTDDLLKKVIDYGRQRDWKYFEARHIAPAQNRPPSLKFCGHILDLTPGKDALFSGMTSEIRTGIRKAQKSAIQIEIARTPESIRTYYQLHCITRRRHGLPPQSIQFYDNIARHVLAAGLGDVVIARHEGRPIASAVYFHFNKKVVYKYGASDKAAQRLRGNNLVMWEAIQHFTVQGMTSLDFGRSSFSDEGLRRFKRNFGAQEYAVDYLRYHFASEQYVQDKDRVKGWYNLVFRHMPTPLARVAGAILYRHLS
jgi:hypothetical protein